MGAAPAQELPGASTASRRAPSRLRPAGHKAGCAPQRRDRVDHVVVTTPEFARTLDALRGAGMEVRRTRDAGSAEKPLRQAFLWAGEVLAEVAGPPERRR